MYKLEPEEGLKLIEGSLATFWFDKDGIFYSKSKNVPRTIDLMKEDFALIKRVTSGERVCIISETTDLPPLKNEVSVFMANEIPTRFKAQAIVFNSQVGQLVSEIYLTLRNHGIPTKIFSNGTEAKAWIRQHLNS